METKFQAVSISTGTILRVFLVALSFWLLYILSDLVLVLLTSVVIASAVEPATRALIRYKIPRVLSVILIYLVTMGAIFSFLYIFVPPLFLDISDLSTAIPKQINSSDILGGSLAPVFELGGLGNKLVVNDLLVQMQEWLAGLAGGVFSAASTIFGGFFSFVMIVVLSFYLAVQERGVENFLRIVVPSNYEPYILGLWRRTQEKIGQWMKGQLVLGLIVGVLVFLGLSILQVKYAFVLALVAALFELIPVFGPILSAVPAIVLGFSEGATIGLLVTGLYLLVQQFENHLIYPLVVRKIVGVSPIIVILSLLVGAKLAGFLGIILSVPVATLLMEIANDIERKKSAEAAR